MVSGRIFQSFSEAHLLVNSLKEFQVPAEAKALPLAKAWRTPRLEKNPWVLRTRPGAGGRRVGVAAELHGGSPSLTEGGHLPHTGGALRPLNPDVAAGEVS